jgi:hypothetical protein
VLNINHDIFSRDKQTKKKIKQKVKLKRSVVKSTYLNGVSSHSFPKK